jgi:hypothetical protein
LESQAELSFVVAAWFGGEHDDLLLVFGVCENVAVHLDRSGSGWSTILRSWRCTPTAPRLRVGYKVRFMSPAIPPDRHDMLLASATLESWRVPVERNVAHTNGIGSCRC